MLIKWSKNKKNKDMKNNSTQELLEKCSVYHIPCDVIRSNTMRSRCDFNEDKLIALAYSIKRYGIIEPLCVKKTDDEDSYDYEIISGERRLRAARLAGFLTVPCVIVYAEQDYSAELSLVENLCSEPLNYFESAVALQRMVENNGVSFDELALRLNISQSELTNKLWLLELDYDERQILLKINASEELAVSVARITDKSLRKRVIEKILYEFDANSYKAVSVENIKNSLEVKSSASLEMPRDVSSAIRGISSRISFLNRHKKRADMKILHDKSTITANIKIKL